MNNTYDIIIIGAGPAGAIAAYQLSGTGYSIAVIDKTTFPRDKICGDALSPDITKQLFLVDPELSSAYEKLSSKKAVSTIEFIAPNNEKLGIDFIKENEPLTHAFVCSRLEFDNFLVDQIRAKKDIDFFEGESVKSVSTSDETFAINTDKQKLHCKMALGADGAHSIINKRLTNNKLDRKHYMAGVRQYWEGVDNYEDSKAIELHFQKDLLPGYFWIFPLNDNRWNIGLGIPSDEVSSNKINLKTKLNDIIQNHPIIKERFKNAKPLEDVQGYGLPIGSKKVKCSGNRFLLLGDAASLIDPFSGEGIGNAIRSGRVAAEHTLSALKTNQFDAEFNKQYDKEIYRRMWPELRVSALMKKLLTYPRLFNLLINKAVKNDSIKTLLKAMVYDLELRKELSKPIFYFKLLFNR